jgi:hypothetical protein
VLTMAVGHSDDVDPEEAIRVAIDQCRTSLGERRPSAGLLFLTADAFDPRLVETVRNAFPGMDLVGGTSSAEISSVNGYQEDSITLAAFASDDVEIGTGLGSGLGEDVEAACASAVRQALADTAGAPKVCVVLHESFVVDAPLVVEGLARALPEGVRVLGGTSARSDFETITPTYQFRNDAVVTNGVAIMTFGGQVEFSTGVGLGFKTIGPKGRVTHSDNTGVYEIDGRPAVEFLNRYVDATGPAAYGNPFAVFEDGMDEFYLRVIRPSKPGTGSLDSAGSIPQGASVQLTTADTDEVLAGTKAALERAAAELPEGARPEAALIFSCAVRKFMLGSRTPIEAELARSVLGDIPTVGTYCYGEVGPVAGATASRFLNETFVTLLLGT